MRLRAEVIVHRDAGLLAKAVAARIITRLVDAQASKGSASLVLTGGGIGGATLRAVRESPAVDAVDWRRLDIWWGDERFVARDSDDRNEKAAREALLDHVDVDPARVFAMGWAGGEDGNDADAAAARYAETLASRAQPEDHGPVPRFDVLLLGLGPEGHVASIFPESPAAHERAHGGRRARLPQAAADPRHPDPARDPVGRRGLGGRRRRREGRRGAAGAVGRRAASGAGRRRGRTRAHAVAARPGGGLRAAAGAQPHLQPLTAAAL